MTSQKKSEPEKQKATEQTIILTPIEAEAWKGVMTEAVRLKTEADRFTQAAEAQRQRAEATIRQIIAEHKAPPLKDGGAVRDGITEGRLALIYESAVVGKVGRKAKVIPMPTSANNRVAAALKAKDKAAPAAPAKE